MNTLNVTNQNFRHPPSARDGREHLYNLPQTGLFSFDAEARTLGCILLDAKVAFDFLATAGITATHFYDSRHQGLFRIMEQLHKAGHVVDIPTVSHRFASSRWAGSSPSADSEYLTQLAREVASVRSLPAFVDELKDLNERRFVAHVGQTLLEAAGNKSAPTAHLLEDAENAVQQMRRTAAPKSFTIRTAAELIAQEVVQNDNILADRLLARGQSLTLLGAGGIGKSRLLLQLAVCCITGRPFLGLRVHQPDFKWLIFQAENSTRRVQDDLRRLQRWLGGEWDRVKDRLFIHTIEQSEDCFVQLDIPGVRGRLSKVIAENDPDVVCFDPLNCFGVGDLNRDSDMRASCQALTQLCAEGRADRAIVVLHHALTGRQGAVKATGFERSSFGRNSKLLQAWTRGQINLAPASADDNTRLVVSCGKCSNGEEFATFAIKLNPETMIYEVDGDFDHGRWKRELSEGDSRQPEDDLLDLCATPLTRVEAVRKLTDKGYSKATAYRIIQNALNQELLRLEGNTLHRVEE